MLREIGITLFLASVGLASGGKFVETVISSNGLIWVMCGFLITTLPLLIVGFIGRKFMKLNYNLIFQRNLIDEQKFKENNFKYN